MLVKLATFAVNTKKHEDEEEKENMMILRLENEMSMLEAKERALIDDEEDVLNDNVFQVELCEDKIPFFIFL